ncbi:MAG: hypothetical protein EAZ61_12900, partial [Oscillatoriales cyanobacterium]
MVLASSSPESLHNGQAAPLNSPDPSDAIGESSWTIEQSEELYRIRGWGEPYFGINAAGRVTVSPKGDRGGAIDLYELVESLKRRNLGLPLLIRFSDILADRIERLNACFSKAITRYSYAGQYRGVFPVKCNQQRHVVEDLVRFGEPYSNQQRHVVEDLVRFGEPYSFGLEAGSKPELLIALAMLKTPGALLICNGYKDYGYIETAMLAQKLGHQPILVLEQPEEVDLAIEVAQNLGLKPCLGVRSKLCA